MELLTFFATKKNKAINLLIISIVLNLSLVAESWHSVLFKTEVVTYLPRKAKTVIYEILVK